MIRIIIGVFWWAFYSRYPRRLEQFDVYRVIFVIFPVIETAFCSKINIIKFPSVLLPLVAFLATLKKVE